MYGHKSSLFWRGVSIMPTANPRKAVVDLVVVERINIFKILWLIFLLLRQNKGNLNIFIIFNQVKFELFRRFHKPFTQMARF